MINVAFISFFWLSLVFGSSEFSKHGQFWSGSSNNTASISSAGQWQNIESASMSLYLDYQNSVLISYNLNIEGLKIISTNPLPRENVKDTLQIRCLVDNIPYRSSSSYISTYGTEQRIVREVSGFFVANMSTKSHTIALQWKKTGQQVSKWRILTAVNSLSYSLSANSDHDRLFFNQETSSSILAINGIWRAFTDIFHFELDENADVILGYSATVQPQLAMFLKDRKQEYISSRIVVDGIPYTEGKNDHSYQLFVYSCSNLLHDIIIYLLTCFRPQNGLVKRYAS